MDVVVVCVSLEPRPRDRATSKCRKHASGRSTAAGEPCSCACNKPEERQNKWGNTKTPQETLFYYNTINNVIVGFQTASYGKSSEINNIHRIEATGGNVVFGSIGRISRNGGTG